ncbi:MAG: phenylalanine--tRNA ligase subunit beta [Pegethrix bostrychoides GSE-TBD4-15B]|jgi:phenylalanyl-tRNA synthetase beta chain|uniref:Phenylalanine--tRNA ligase beta subunit n=1 Tax=Pegethrix bostrychoides GSE-TBD4-15B TaxID=2839662 RepID=A0A951PAQ9_9CYAN|nr:phenylalanine--tRNA ligase subunit beta [Pegethrix bostrychoides GSE-TBD4-15B]
MRISLNWLKDLVDITLTPEALAEALTMAGFEVEEIEDRRSWADGVVIGKVLSCEKHPNADKLSLCTVDIGTEQPASIICGAANVRADIFVAVATLGTYLPKIDLKIKPRKLRDVPSEGMICSLTEVGLAKDSEGIHIFEQPDLQPGSDARPYLGLDDVILDLTSTANRADALSMVGIAREVAAITGVQLHLPEIPELTAESSDALSVKIEQGSSSYRATLIAVQLAPSPDWLQRRLVAAGSRPINNIVDVTNYIMLEWGQPLHAFDYDRLQAVAGIAADKPLNIGVRQARSGEKLTTLDGQQRSLQDLALLITANDQPVALAGVMGGESTEVHAASQTILLEAAVFDPAAIRRSARAQGMRTEASARYERGVNPAELMLANRRAVDLLQQLAEGQVIAQAAELRTQPTERQIQLRLERVNQVLGPVLGAEMKAELGRPEASSRSERELTAEDMTELKPADVERTLRALGCEVTALQPDVWNVTVPPYRYRDLEREIDLIEEVARLYGYNNFCDTLPSKTEAGFLPDEQLAIRQIHAALRAAGLTEVIHYTLGKPDLDSQVVLANPLFAEYSALRIELISGLVDAFQRNLEQGNGALNAFEIGRVFWRDEVGLAEEDRVAGILGGDPRQGRWVTGGRPEPLTWYEAKGCLESLFLRLGLAVEYQPDRRNPMLHPGRTASLWLNGDRLGTFGQLHPQLRQQRDLPDELYSFELSLDTLLDHMLQEERLVPIFQPYSSYPASDRDIAFFAPVKFSVAEIERAIRQAAGALLGSVELFDEYRGSNVPDHQRSLAFRLLYRASDRTLTEAEIEPIHQQVREALEERFQAVLRS